MADISIKFNAKAFDDFLKRYPKESAKVIDKSLKQSALVVQNRAKINAPYLTGNLRRSITHDVGEGSASIGTNVIYAAVREYNTRRKPDGYLRPALEKNADKINKIFVDNFTLMINKI